MSTEPTVDGPDYLDDVMRPIHAVGELKGAR